jgi:hypothetical protein
MWFLDLDLISTPLPLYCGQWRFADGNQGAGCLLGMLFADASLQSVKSESGVDDPVSYQVVAG